MKRAYGLSLNEAINIRDFFPDSVRPQIRTSWVGMCGEILAALEGQQDDDHIVERVDGRRLVFRKGYPYAHFIEVQGAAFCNPWWSRG